MNIRQKALELHKKNRGKIEIKSTVELNNLDDLALAYTPGVAEPCKEINKDIKMAYEYTRKWNTVAIVTDGTAVLGLGDIGPEAALPVMEGKAVLFKNFAGVDAIPICLKCTDVDEIVKTIENISPTFGGINLEDIAAPRCFEIEDRLKKSLDIPVFHDDQHGTAIVSAAALINAAKVVNKDLKKLSVVINGAGAAGAAIGKLLLKLGIDDIIVCDRKGALAESRSDMTEEKRKLARQTNKTDKQGNLSEVIKGADVFIGVSVANVLTKEMVQSMAKDAIIFAMANPIPEILPDEAKEAGAKVTGTGRSDFENQINNVLAFPGIFRGALDIRAKDINEEMKIAAAYAIASLIEPEELTDQYIIPQVFDKRVVEVVAKAVEKAALESGVASI